MEQVFTSDYEDVYKVKDGVMFHVKKYSRVRDEKTGIAEVMVFRLMASLILCGNRGAH